MTTTRGPANLSRRLIEFPDLVQPLAPPEVPAGWSVSAPDFVGVGAMRSGTTWWWWLMSQHPKFATVNVFNKEVHFFDHYMSVEAIEAEAYHRYFPRPAGSVAGEWTPRYMFDYWTPPMLRQAAPDAKILVMLRDPLERYVSALGFSRQRGVPPSHVVLSHQFSRSLYGQQVGTLLRHFPRDQVLVLQYERCAAEPLAQLYRTFSFIGLDPAEWRFEGDLAGTRLNEGKGPRPDIAPETRETLAEAFRVDLAPLFEMLPDIDPTLWPMSRG